MNNTLKLYKEVIDEGKPEIHPFPGSGQDWAYISDYKYSSTRMPSAPSITTTLKWPSCLDKEWTASVFVEYKGERYFVKNTPSSSYDNTSRLYSHELNLVSERAVLDNVYFLNAATKTSDEGENVQGDSLSNSSEFSFSGDINEFIDRLNRSLGQSGVGGELGYTAIADEGVVSETKLFSISKQYVADVLKSAYELYGVPYYFVGREIHFGAQQNDISTPLRYGANDSLLSISKTNLNKQVVTRITGYGSSRNIPYYYPNPTPKGKLKLAGTASSKYEIVNQLAFSSNIELNSPIVYKQAEGNIGTSTGTPVTDSEYDQINDITAIGDHTFYFQGYDIVYKLECTCYNRSGFLPNFVPIALGFDTYLGQTNWADYFISGEVRTTTGTFITAITPESEMSNYLGFEKHPNMQSRLLSYTIFFRGPSTKKPVYFSALSSNVSGDSFSFNSYKLYKAVTGFFEADMNVIVDGGRGKGHVYSIPTMHVGGKIVKGSIDLFKGGELYSGGDIITRPYREGDKIYFGKLATGTYHLKTKFTLPADASLTNSNISYSTIKHNFWEVVAKGTDVNINKAGLALSSFELPSVGDTLIQEIDYRIDVKNTLMPSEYRRTFGRNMWYNATNDPNRGDWYGDVKFNHPYNSKRPVEYIHSDDEIYPTIKGMTNARNEYIDTFLDIAFDKHDNNEIYPEDYEDEKLAGKYKHPYFFVKLKKTDGANGFNLFDHAIENEPMKISFTSGHVAGCEFEIGVDEDTRKNPVQVDENGDLVRDENDDVVIRGSYIDSQQDTQNNEVWLALKKEDSTMGVLMPDATAGLIPLGDLSPNGGDTFVILGIHLPEAYITAAEDRLEKELIEYLYDNNDERFSFSIKFSSIYLAENPDLASIINENCRVRLIYDDVEYAMFATSCSITVKEGVALPEVTLNIDNELKLVKPKVKDVSAIIAATEKKIKEVKDSTAEVRTSVLGANISAKDNTEKIRQLQEEKVSEADLENLEYNINGQSGLYNTKENVKVPAFYAATDAGTEGQILQSTGLGAPRWVDVSKLTGVNADWSNIGSKPTTIKGYGITDCYTKTEVNPTIEKANSALQYITSPEPEDGDYISLSVGEKTGSNTQEVNVTARIAQLNTSADGLVTASDARAYVEQAKAEVAENIERVESTVTTRLIPSQTAFLGSENKVMVWNGSSTMMSLPIANGLDDWGKTNSLHGYLVTDQQVQAKIDSIANKSEVVDFAKDLTGVLEATAEEFTFRPSAGDKSIRDESAVIRRIKGNTTVWGQLADITASLTNSDSGYIVERSEDRMSFSITRVGSSATNFWCSLNMNTAYRVLGHKFLFVADAEASNITSDDDYVSVTNYNLTTPNHNFKLLENRRALYSCISTPLEGSTGWQFAFYAYGNAKLTVHNLQCFDLTSIFGAGNEPSTYEDFKAIYPDIYPYCEPEVRNVNTTLIMTIGFNQWDEQWELGALSTADGRPVGNNERGRSVNFFDVIPNATYYCDTIAPTTTNSSGTVGSMGVWWYDSSQTMIKYEDITNKTRVAPSNARYAKICTYGGDVNAIFNGGVNINLSHTGVRNGEYEPYKKNIRLLPEIRKYFPNGMNGNANVWDEINSEKAIKRWGVVDLGTLTWNVQQASVNIFWSNSVSSLKKAPYGSYPNAISIFDTGRFYDLQVAKSNGVTTEIIGIHDAQARILLYNPNYEATTEGASQLKASLQGVLLYYELTEPEYTDITEPMQLDYEVEDFGTEKALSLASSAPFRADIVYQFNAEGRIRDNSRNIERLEGNIDNLTPTFQASLGVPYRLMAWDGTQTWLSLPIAKSIADWEMEESPYEAIPTGQQVIDYISAIKGSLATGLIPKETLTIDASGFSLIDPNKVYEITTRSSTTYNWDLYLSTTSGVDVVADNEWRIRIDTRNGFSGSIGIYPVEDDLREYEIRWAYPEDEKLGAGTAPTIVAGHIWDIQFRMIGKTLLGSYKKY